MITAAEKLRLEIVLEVLKELNKICEGAERVEFDDDDLSGVNGRYSFDSETFRRNLQNRVDELTELLEE